MPELPEVETVRRGLEPLLVGRTITSVVLRAERLRWPLRPELSIQLVGQPIHAVSRRAKYLLLRCESGTLLLHLGMSGVLRLLPMAIPPQRHDHVDLVLDDGNCLRLNDPRRFGALIWCDGDVVTHPLLVNLGPEPLSTDFDGDYLARRAAGRRGAVKNFLMDQRIVVGVGNIYASEALFRAGIDPARPAGEVGRDAYRKLAVSVRAVLEEALAQGGTTLRDFNDAHGQPGYFAQKLQVYGRKGLPCVVCGTPIRVRRLGGRSSFDCPQCQS
jgi:formamidopyrimidine-DNA glycosylase